MSSINDTLKKLESDDATTRMRAVIELGEIGTHNEAPKVLHQVWNDSSSNNQQIAIQAYMEIMNETGLENLVNVIEKHHDEFVKQFAISELGKLSAEKVKSILERLIHSQNANTRAIVLRSMIRANTNKLASLVKDHLVNETDSLVIQNCIEALGLWKHKKSKILIEDILEKYSDDIEIKTICLFSLAVFDNKAIKRLEKEVIDESKGISIRGKRYRGKKGLLEVIKLI